MDKKILGIVFFGLFLVIGIVLFWIKNKNKPAFRSAVFFCKSRGNDGEEQEKKMLKPIQDRMKGCDSIIINQNEPFSFDKFKGDYDVVLFTGTHGDFNMGQPISCNGMSSQALRKALESSQFTAQCIILDTCFGSAFIPHFVEAGAVFPGGKIICTLGECQGFSQGIKDSKRGESLEDIFKKLSEGLYRLSDYQANSLYEHHKNLANNKLSHGILYTRKYSNRAQLIEETADIHGDTEDNLNELETYLREKGVIIEKKDKEELQEIFSSKLIDIHLSV
jgi:hypothetical protein